MLGQTSSTDSTPAPAVPTVARDVQAEALKAIAAIEASPEFQTLGDSFDDNIDPMHQPLIAEDSLFGGDPLFGDEYLTSPMGSMLDDFGTSPRTSPMDTPFSDFLATPVMDTLDSFDSPLITDRGFVDDRPLFGAASAFPTFDIDTTPPPPPAPKLPSTDKLWTFSPSSPMLDSIPAPEAPVVPAAPAPAPAPKTRRRSGVTGTRKNITPASLIPLDAPTQKRTYVTPSATSRKAVPAGFRNKRAHSEAFPEEDEEQLGELSPTASEQEMIEYKRRQNTIAARKSRKRKLEYQQNLEDELDALRADVTMWRERALMAQEMLRSSGLTNFSFENVEEKKA